MLILIRSRSKKHRRIFQKKVGIVLAVVAFFALTPFLVYWVIKGEGLVASVVPTKVMLPAVIQETNEKAPVVAAQRPGPRPEDITTIADASSELHGRWHGLCQKRSVRSVEDFQRTVASDPVLSRHFAGFNWETAKIGRLSEEVLAVVTHREGDVIRPTSKPIKLPKGDAYITDGVRTARTYCCNDIDLMPSAGLPKKDVDVASEFPTVAVSEFPVVPTTPADNPPTTPPSSPDIPPYTPPSPHYDDDTPTPSPVPEPESLLLLGIGLVVLAAVGRKKK